MTTVPDFYDDENECTIHQIGEYVVVCDASYIDFLMVKVNSDGMPFCDTWAEGGLSLEQARQVATELAAAILFLENNR